MQAVAGRVSIYSGGRQRLADLKTIHRRCRANVAKGATETRAALSKGIIGRKIEERERLNEDSTLIRSIFSTSRDNSQILAGPAARVSKEGTRTKRGAAREAPEQRAKSMRVATRDARRPRCRRRVSNQVTRAFIPGKERVVVHCVFGEHEGKISMLDLDASLPPIICTFRYGVENPFWLNM